MMAFRHHDQDYHMAPPTAQMPIHDTTNGVSLSAQQQEVLQSALNGNNVFYTGSAGSGKSLVLGTIVGLKRARGERVVILAATGRAALDINGITPFTYAGWTPDSMKKSMAVIEREALNRHTKKRFVETDVLVIDEISMISSAFLDRLNRVMQKVRANYEAFGGVQVVVTGDFCQLPPVKPFTFCPECGKEMHIVIEATEYICEMHGTYYDHDKWAFCSEAWAQADFEVFNLRNIYRQTDPELIRMLEKLRVGFGLSHSERRSLINHSCDVRGGVQLCSTKRQVQSINNAELRKLPGRKYTYHCVDHFKHNPDHKHLEFKGKRTQTGDSILALEDHRYSTHLDLKLGIRVVLLQNIDIEKGLVNGSQGSVVSFESFADSTPPRATSRAGENYFGPDDRRERLATHGVRSIGGDHVYLRQDQIQEFMSDTRNRDQVWPVVQFTNGRRVTVRADCSVTSMGDDEPYSLLARTQIPLCAAWALTIHKSQGMTLDKVIVDVSKMFEAGQLYVALSRAKSLYGLKLEGYEGDFEIMGANEEVKTFLRETFGDLL